MTEAVPLVDAPELLMCWLRGIPTKQPSKHYLDRAVAQVGKPEQASPQIIQHASAPN